MIANPYRALLVLLVLAGFALPAGGQKIKSDDNQRYLLLATTKTSTMQKELDEATALGFRVAVSSPTSSSEMVVLLERQEPGSRNYAYKLLATSKTETMEKELNEAAGEGYRLLPRTMIAKQQAFIGPEIVVLMERAPGEASRFHYKLLATTRTSTMQKEITEAIAEGYTLAGMVSRGEHMVIMEKEIGGKKGAMEPAPADTAPKPEP